MELAIQAYVCLLSVNAHFQRAERSIGKLTVPFMAKMKTIRKREKYLAPLFSANMKMKHPVSTIGTGYMKNQKRLPTRSLASE